MGAIGWDAHADLAEVRRAERPDRIDAVAVSSKEQWFAVHTRSRHEKIVARQLLRSGVSHWLPLIQIRKRWSDRFVTIQEPLFPGYLFAHIIADDFLAVVRCLGVVKIVGSGRRPHPVDPYEIERIRKALEGNMKCDPCPYLRLGMEVEVVRGPLRGFRGILVLKDRNHRLVLSVRLISQSVAVEIGLADVKPI
jgi:transcription antitermination factor NusG